ncbi:hypothetical protein B6G06_09125 [Actinomyces gaoshouyii]|nr:hypothetical protein B6G06_09125 [Actinomyces gaoshouyii]
MFDERAHPRGADGRWTTHAPAAPAANLTGLEAVTLRIAHPEGARAIPQAAIDYAMHTGGRDFGPDDVVEVEHPAYNVYLPDTAAVVTVRGGSVCRTSDRSQGRFEVRDGARLIARGRASVHAYASTVDVHDQAGADLHEGTTAHLYGADGSVRARPGTTVYAWAGTVHADAGATVWIMGPRVTLDTAPGTYIGDGVDSPIGRQAARLVEEDIFERHRLNAETGVYDLEPQYSGDRQRAASTRT